jgi:menaquinone-dependent protoporphyrinogen oxidase
VQCVEGRYAGSLMPPTAEIADTGLERRTVVRSVVVGYGTKRGSTREVAEAVAAVLRERDFAVELLPAREIKDVRRYDGVVLGGALYRGRWHRDARRLLKRHRGALAEKPVAVFGMGPRRHEPEAFERSRNQLERALAKVPEVKPVSAGSFGGVDRERRLDVRDWGAIHAWAAEVANAFDAASAQEPSPDES